MIFKEIEMYALINQGRSTLAILELKRVISHNYFIYSRIKFTILTVSKLASCGSYYYVRKIPL